jgi:hypothetical protein
MLGKNNVSLDSKQKLIYCYENLPFFIDQLTSHLESCYRAMTKNAEPGEANKPSTMVVDAVRIALRARMLHLSGLRIPNVLDPPNKKVPSAKFLCDANHLSDLPLAELVEMLYVPISNAHRIMNNEDNPETLRMEVLSREIEYEGVVCTILEIFNTGPLVDFNALSRAMLKLPDVRMEDAKRFRPIINAINTGSRQARLNPTEEMLILEGLTLTTKGTGIGLNNLRRHLALRGGVLLLNNVYGKEEGFCCTLILPKGIVPGGMNTKLRQLKELLQSGEYLLKNVTAERSLSA